MKNKKANLPITILVIGIVALCGLTILSFIISIKKFPSEEWGFELVEKVKIDLDKFYFYKNVGFIDEEAAEKINANFYSKENRLEIIRKRENVEVIYNEILNKK
jgi:hypothetical protein